MSSKSTPPKAQTREDRLKAALKANMGRRKAQARARAAVAAVAAAETAEQEAGADAPDAQKKEE